MKRAHFSDGTNVPAKPRKRATKSARTGTSSFPGLDLNFDSQTPANCDYDGPLQKRARRTNAAVRIVADGFGKYADMPVAFLRPTTVTEKEQYLSLLGDLVKAAFILDDVLFAEDPCKGLNPIEADDCAVIVKQIERARLAVVMSYGPGREQRADDIVSAAVARVRCWARRGPVFTDTNDAIRFRRITGSQVRNLHYALYAKFLDAAVNWAEGQAADRLYPYHPDDLRVAVCSALEYA